MTEYAQGESLSLDFQFEFNYEGEPPYFYITLDGKTLLTVTYNRDVLVSPEDAPEGKVATLARRFESLLRQKMTAATAQLLLEAMIGDSKQPLQFFERLSDIDDVKSRVGVKRGKKPKLSDRDKANLEARYRGLHSVYSELKQVARAVNERSVKGQTCKDWLNKLKAYAADYVESGVHPDLIERLSDLDPYASSPSEIALEHLSREAGYTVEYLRKVLARVRGAKQRTKQPKASKKRDAP